MGQHLEGDVLSRQELFAFDFIYLLLYFLKACATMPSCFLFFIWENMSTKTGVT